jgi:hypothetical protein
MVDELVAEGMLNSRGKEDMDHSGCTPVLFTLQCVQDGCRAWSVAQWVPSRAHPMGLKYGMDARTHSV